MKNTWVRLLLGLAIPLAACGDDTGGGSGSGSGGASGSTTGSGSDGFMGSCDTRTAGPADGQCRDWSGDGSADVSVSCDGIGGTFSATDPCIADGRVGSCVLEPVLGTEATYNYYDPAYDAATAEEHCTTQLEGTFTAG